MNTGKYTCLEIFAKQTAKDGRVIVCPEKQADGAGLSVMEQAAGETYYAWLKFQVQPDAEYEIRCESCDISLCYLSGNENIFETGIRYLEKNPTDESFYAADPSVWYNRAFREAYHFSPWKNWVNDPNGLCWFQGYYHMFYQFNPHGQEWSNMYWGHTASRDLVHWIHLPIALSPQEEILERPDEIKGGAFSGCAVVAGDEAVFYLTRHKGPLQDGRDTVEQQWMMKSRDMIHFTGEKCVIANPPKGASFDFRDPKVIRVGEKWYMVLGSAMDGKSAILLYESKDMEHWEYAHPLLLEDREKIRCFECPDFMELDGKYAAIGAWMEHRDEGGRYQMSRYYTGDLHDGRFEIVNDGWFDFGSNCYAMQSFEHQGRRISIGWISDFYGEHQEMENGVCGSMTIPREMHIRDNRLYLTPVKEMEALKSGILYQGQEEEICLKGIIPNTYKAELEFTKDIPFSICLSENDGSRMMLVNDEKGLRLTTHGVKSEHITFPADVERVEKLEIFVDRRTAEIYVNDGEAAGTKLFYDTSDQGCFILHTDTPECIKRAEVFCMRSIWER